MAVFLCVAGQGVFAGSGLFSGFRGHVCQDVSSPPDLHPGPSWPSEKQGKVVLVCGAYFSSLFFPSIVVGGGGGGGGGVGGWVIHNPR